MKLDIDSEDDFSYDSPVRRCLQRGALPGHTSAFKALVDTGETSPGQSKSLLDISGRHLLASLPNCLKAARFRTPSPGLPAFLSVAKALPRNVRRLPSRAASVCFRLFDGGVNSRRGPFLRLQAGEGRAAGRRSPDRERMRRDRRAAASCRGESADAPLWVRPSMEPRGRSCIRPETDDMNSNAASESGACLPAGAPGDLARIPTAPVGFSARGDADSRIAPWL